VESGFRAIARLAGDQQLQHPMFLAEETTDRLGADIRKHLKGVGDLTSAFACFRNATRLDRPTFVPRPVRRGAITALNSCRQM
jgi:hypothetical protein